MQNKLNWLEVIGIETPLAKSETRIKNSHPRN